MCDVCHERLFAKRDASCPECRGSLTDKKNLFMEKILGELPQTGCKYAGCTYAKADVNRVKRHQDDCCHRLVQCHQCGSEVGLSSLYTHVNEEHDKSGALPSSVGLPYKRLGSTQIWHCDQLSSPPNSAKTLPATTEPCQTSSGKRLSQTTRPPSANVGNKRFSWWGKDKQTTSQDQQQPQNSIAESDKEVSNNAKITSNIRCIPVQLEDMSKTVSFFVNLVLAEGRYLFWVSHDQSKYDETSYEYTVALLTSNKSGSDLSMTPVGDPNEDERISTKSTTRLVKYTGHCSPSDVTVAAMTSELFCLVIPERVVRKSAMNNKDEKIRFELQIDKSRNMIT